MNDKLIIYGASGHGKVVADIAKLNGYKNILFYDDDQTKHEIGQYQVIHDLKVYNDWDMIIAIGDNGTREAVSKREDKEYITLIHPQAVIAEDVEIGNGVVIMANAVVNSGSVIKDGCIINTCASVDHDNILEDYSHVSVNAHTAGTVHIGKRAMIGIGASIINNISICDDAIIGAGSVVIRDINEAGTYVGVPVEKI